MFNVNLYFDYVETILYIVQYKTLSRQFRQHTIKTIVQSLQTSLNNFKLLSDKVEKIKNAEYFFRQINTKTGIFRLC